MTLEPTQQPEQVDPPDQFMLLDSDEQVIGVVATEQQAIDAVEDESNPAVRYARDRT